MGPDGRMFILTGTALIGAAAVGGLFMRRRSIKG
jgi:MYXO-CTERM domain-containing protein